MSSALSKAPAPTAAPTAAAVIPPHVASVGTPPSAAPSGLAAVTAMVVSAATTVVEVALPPVGVVSCGNVTTGAVVPEESTSDPDEQAEPASASTVRVATTADLPRRGMVVTMGRTHFLWGLPGGGDRTIFGPASPDGCTRSSPVQPGARASRAFQSGVVRLVVESGWTQTWSAPAS